MKLKATTERAVLIFGKQGSGKTTLANILAKNAGIFASLPPRALREPFGLSILADCRIDALIIEDIDLETDLEYLRDAIFQKEVIVNRRMKPQVDVRTPSLILTTTEKSFVDLLEKDPYFLVLEI